MQKLACILRGEVLSTLKIVNYMNAMESVSGIAGLHCEFVVVSFSKLISDNVFLDPIKKYFFKCLIVSLQNSLEGRLDILGVVKCR